MGDEFRIVVVCTANICRSPMAEAMIRRGLRAGGANGVVVESAGVYGHEDSPIAPGSASALRALGIEDDGHRGRRLTPEIVGSADLVLTMEERHREAILARSPEAQDRTFALREFARLVGGAAPPEGDVAARARALVRVAGLRRTALPWAGVDDVPDPYGGPGEGYHACAALILGEVGTLLRPLLSPPRS
jgi:protein-tyrosine phosphatase